MTLTPVWSASTNAFRLHFLPSDSDRSLCGRLYDWCKAPQFDPDDPLDAGLFCQVCTRVRNTS